MPSIINPHTLGHNTAFYTQVLQGIGAPITPENLRVMEAWQTSEGPQTGVWNPFNSGETIDRTVHPTRRLHTTYYAPSVVNYLNEHDGVTAIVTNLLNGLYPQVVQGFRNNDPGATIAAIVESPWAGSHYNAQQGPSGYVANTSTLWKVYYQGSSELNQTYGGGAVGITGTNQDTGQPLPTSAPTLMDRIGSIPLVGGALAALPGISELSAILSGASWIENNRGRIGLMALGILAAVGGFVFIVHGVAQ